VVKANQPPGHESLYRRIMLLSAALFVLLLLVTIGAVYRVGQNSMEAAEQQLQSRLEVAAATLEGERKRLETVGLIVREQNRKWVELLNYDNYDAIGMVLQNSAAYFSVDLMLMLTPEQVIASRSPFQHPAERAYHDLASRLGQRPSLHRIDGQILRRHLGSYRLPPQSHYLCLAAVIQVDYGAIDVAGQVMLLQVIDDNQRLIAAMSDMAKAEVEIRGPEGTALVSSLPDGAGMAGEYRLLTARQPLRSEAGTSVGELVVGLDRGPYRSQVGWQLASNLIPLLATGALFIYLLLLLRSDVFTPLRQLAVTARRVARGRLDARTPVAPGRRDDEITLITDSFNHMLDRLARSHRKLEEARRQALDEKRLAESANAMKSRFLANISHEIRTPLTAVIGFAETLGEHALPPAQKQAVLAIERNGRHLLSLVNDLLDLSRIEAGRLEVRREETALFELLEAVREVTLGIIAGRVLEFREHYHYPLPRTFPTDPTRLRQILINLLTNAVKFTEEGHVALTVSYHPRSDTLRFVVSDTGIGIPPEQIRHLFAPFRQADPEIARRFGGTGLGLHISQLLAHRLGGEITVQSVPGQGSRFTLELQCEPVPEHALIYSCEKPATPPALPAERQPLLRGRVLVAEDGPDNRTLIGILLQKFGLEYEMVENGEEALAALASGGYDLVLMDLQMPGLDGLAATERLRAGGSAIPVVALTADLLADAHSACRRAGCDAVVGKPIDQQALHAELSRFLPSAGPRTADSLCETLDTGDLETIRTVFRDHLPRYLDDIRDAITAEAWPELRRHLHTFRGAVGHFDHPDLVERIQRAEAALQAGAYDTVRRETAALLDRCEAELGSAARPGAGTA